MEDDEQFDENYDYGYDDSSNDEVILFEDEDDKKSDKAMRDELGFLLSRNATSKMKNMEELE